MRYSYLFVCLCDPVLISTTLQLYFLRWFCLPCVRCFALPCVALRSFCVFRSG